MRATLMTGSWNWLDWILFAVVLVSALAGARKGFARELIGFASLIVGLVVAAAEYQRAAAPLGGFIHSRELALGAAFLGLFCTVLILGGLTSALARRFVRESGIQWADRLLGAIFGLARGVLVDAAVLMAMVAFAIRPVAVQGSRLAPYVVVGSRGIAFLMPPGVRGRFRAGFSEFERELVESDRRAFENGSPQP